MKSYFLLLPKETVTVGIRMQQVRMGTMCFLPSPWLNVATLPVPSPAPAGSLCWLSRFSWPPNRALFECSGERAVCAALSIAGQEPPQNQHPPTPSSLTALSASLCMKAGKMGVVAAPGPYLHLTEAQVLTHPCHLAPGAATWKPSGAMGCPCPSASTVPRMPTMQL